MNKEKVETEDFWDLIAKLFYTVLLIKLCYQIAYYPITLCYLIKCYHRIVFLGRTYKTSPLQNISSTKRLHTKRLYTQRLLNKTSP
jgi:hypothetical protein